MEYSQYIYGKFNDRPNRFIAHVWVGASLETVHVKNTGRCKELLLPGCDVVLAISDNKARKTKYDLVAVYKESVGWINMDSQAPNQVVKEWLKQCDFTYVKPEYVYGQSRIDFYMERGNERFLMEVKGCTLEIDGIGYFPDAPTERGIKHLEELAKAVGEGYHAILAFVIQMNHITEVRPNIATHKAFGDALDAAQKAGVRVLFLTCDVTPSTLSINADPIRIIN